MEITGSTRLLAIVADPVAHVKTPQRLNALLERLGTDAVMVACHVAPDALPAFLAGARAIRNLDGLVVTVPHKEAAAALCDELTPAARAIGAVNAVRVADGRLTGGNFDGIGFVAGLRRQGHEPAGRRVYLAGAGGAGKAIAHALAEAGVAGLSLHNRSRDKAQAVASQLHARFPHVPVTVVDDIPGDCDIAINATSLGLKDDDPLPFAPQALAPGALVADAVMRRDDTPLLAAALACGCRVHPGRYMLEGQLSEIARFLGIAAPD